ncbi:MAG: hypothetical protein L0312_20105 [Acidobacteria bacterium]|nr:hypothetical protein [Acidobacteriota bacterium]
MIIRTKPLFGPIGPIVRTLKARLEKSRFTASVFIDDERKEADTIRIETVRLRIRKLYCGQHAGPCLVNPIFNRRHFKAIYLEGADWIGFDDMLNDVLDEMSMDAKVWSSRAGDIKGRLYIRRGRKRRIHYDMIAGHDTAFGTVYVWDGAGEEDDFYDCIDLPKPFPPSAYPAGTPGLAEWRFSVTCQACNNDHGERCGRFVLCHQCELTACHNCLKQPRQLRDGLCRTCRRIQRERVSSNGDSHRREGVDQLQPGALVSPLLVG